MCIQTPQLSLLMLNDASLRAKGIKDTIEN
jgi:hypothetical protein